LATLVSTLVTDRVQVFLLEWLASPTTVGLFALAFGLAGQILTPVQAAVGPLVPAVSALTERGPEAARAGLLRITRLSAVTTGLVISAGAPMLAGLIPFIYGTDYAPAADLFLVMVCSSGFVVVGAVSYASLMARLQGARYLRVNLLALLVMAVVAFAAIPPLGAWGAVASVVAGTLARAFLMVGIEARHHRVGIAELLSAFAPVLMAGGATLGVWFLGVANVTAGPWVLALGGALVASALYVLGVKATRSGVRSADRDMLLSTVPRRLRPAMSLTLRVLAS
jgi:O-antigen/teichoic acid export membrane protein